MDQGMFFGAFFRSLDGKGRFILPAELRDAVPEEERKKGFILTAGVDECVFLFTEPMMGQVLERVEEQAHAKVRIEGLDGR